MKLHPTPEQIITTTPILVEALAEAAHCGTADAAEHLAHVFDEGEFVTGSPVSHFLDLYAAA